MIQKVISIIYSTRFIYYIRKSKSKHVLIVAPPKTGSTWLSYLLQNLTSWTNAQLVEAFGHREQEIDIRKLVQYSRKKDLFSPHLHLRFSEPTLEILNKNNISVVFLYRNIFESIRSLYYHFEDESTVFPMVYIPQSHWESFNINEKKNWLINNFLNWYLTFYNGWFENKHCLNQVFFEIDYNFLKNNTQKSLISINNTMLNIKITSSEIDNIVYDSNKANTRKNNALKISLSEFYSKEQKNLIKVILSNSYINPKINALNLLEIK